MKVDAIKAPIREVKKGRVQKTEMDFACLLPSSWLAYSLSIGGEQFLGGHCLDSGHLFEEMFSGFWTKYQILYPDFPFFQRPDYPEIAKLSIPILVHGDEGRGSCKRPIMCLSVQPLVGWQGIGTTNSSGLLIYISEMPRSIASRTSTQDPANF